MLRNDIAKMQKQFSVILPGAEGGGVGKHLPHKIPRLVEADD